MCIRDRSYIASHLPFTFELETAQIFGDNIAAAAKANQVKRVVFNTSCYVHDTDLDIGGHDGRRRIEACLLYTSPSPRDRTRSRMPSSA